MSRQPESPVRHPWDFLVASWRAPASATGWRWLNAETRFGVHDLRAEPQSFRAGGLSNRTQLRVTERSCFRATQSPFVCADSEY